MVSNNYTLSQIITKKNHCSDKLLLVDHLYIQSSDYFVTKLLSDVSSVLESED